MKTKEMLAILVLALGLATEVANADFTFGEPVNLGPTVNTLYWEACQSVSADGLTLYFGEVPGNLDPSGYGGGDIWVTMRNKINDAWGSRTNLGPTVNTSSGEAAPCMSADGLSLYFASNRASGYGRWDLWMATRETTSDLWGEPVNLGPTVNSSADEVFPSISANGLELYFSGYGVARPGGYGSADLWVTKRPTKGDPWGTPVNLGDTVNGWYYDAGPFISTDSLTLLFTSHRRPGGISDADDIWMTRRTIDSDLWCTPVNLGPPINGPFQDGYPSLSADGSTLYFCSDRSGSWDLWQASVIPIVDFNGDGIVDADDMCIMIDNWGTDNSLCDIGPMPWGDGIVDVQDLIVLSEHLFEDYRLIGHWKLDETEGDIAYDSAGNNHGTLNGDPQWVSGFIDGALEFDGVDDYVAIGDLDLTGSFTLTCWMRPSSLPGGWHTVVIKEFDYGFEFDGTIFWGEVGRGAYSWGEVSTTISTPAIWYHAALTWNGSDVEMFIDGSSVGQDTGGTHVSNNNPLLFGSWDTSSEFFDGIIDDVRIYNVALTAEEIEALVQ